MYTECTTLGSLSDVDNLDPWEMKSAFEALVLSMTEVPRDQHKSEVVPCHSFCFIKKVTSGHATEVGVLEGRREFLLQLP